jgi:predicted transcriptional regulator
MEILPLTSERKAQLEEYTQRHGLDPSAALDDGLDAYLEWERHDYQEAVEGVRRGYADFQAGRTQPAEEVFEERRAKHGLSRRTDCSGENRLRLDSEVADCKRGR